MQIVDGYMHCGLKKYLPIERVRDVMAQAEVRRAVLVQHLGEFDNSYIGELASSDSTHFAAVGLLDHTRPDATVALNGITRLCKGVRITATALREAPALWRQAVSNGLIIVYYAPDGAADITPLRALLEERNDCRIVVSHLGNPALSEQPHFKSSEALLDLARFPNVYFQISGMKMFCPWPHEPLYPLIAQAAERFGADRLLWGSNFPVVGDARDYRDDLQLLLAGRLPIAPDAIPAVAGLNARRLWFSDADSGWHARRVVVPRQDG